MGMAALALEEPYSIDRIISVFLVSYFFWGMSFSTTVYAESVTKKRGWIFPYFKSEYHQLKRIELRTLYIYQHEYGAQSRYILYVGIINGVSNEFVNLSWGVRETESGEGYREFVNQLKKLTNLPITVNEEFEAQFKQKYGSEFSYD